MTDNTLPYHIVTEENTLYLKWFGVPFYISMLLLFSKITVYLTNTSFYTTPLSWFCDMLIFYAWHVQAHYKLPFIPFNSLCNEYHNLHHYTFFPANYFYGSTKAKEWKDKNKTSKSYLIFQSLPLHELSFFDSLKNESFALFFVFVKILIMYIFIKLSVLTIIMTLIQGLLVNFIGNYLHLSFHVENHFLNKYKLYRELKYLHYLHHKGDTKHNYGIFFFGFDKWFETYKRK